MERRIKIINTINMRRRRLIRLLLMLIIREQILRGSLKGHLSGKEASAR